MHAPTVLHLEDVHATDGGLAVATMLLGGVGLLLIAVGGAQAAQVAVFLGAAGSVAGLTGQYLSRTTSERFLDVIGLVMSSLAFAIGLAFA